MKNEIKRSNVAVMAIVMAMCIVFASPVQALALDNHRNDFVATIETTELTGNDFEDSQLETIQNRDSIARYYDLRVMVGESYREDYFDPINQAMDTVWYVHIPFLNTWSMRFMDSYTNINNLPIDFCELSNDVRCTDSDCGSNCNNNLTDYIHHKNGIKNLYIIKNNISDEGYDLMLTIVSAAFCRINTNEEHVIGPLGVTNAINGNYALVTAPPSMSTNIQVRIMQHEICHMFSCVDGGCTGPCIMNGGYDDVSLYTPNIWCSSCSEDFNPAAQS